MRLFRALVPVVGASAVFAASLIVAPTVADAQGSFSQGCSSTTWSGSSQLVLNGKERVKTGTSGPSCTSPAIRVRFTDGSVSNWFQGTGCCAVLQGDFAPIAGKTFAGGSHKAFSTQVPIGSGSWVQRDT